MTPTTKPSSTDQAWAAAERAAADYLEGLGVVFTLPPAQIDLAPHHDVLRPVFDAVKPGLAELVISEAERLLGNVRATAALTGYTSGDVLIQQGQVGLAQVSMAVDAALLRFERQGELDAAEQTVQDLQRQSKTAMAALEDAVATADIDAVMRLRPEVEVRLPVKLGEAKLAVLDLQLERLRAEQQQADRRAAPVEKATADAHAALAAALAQVETAKAVLAATQSKQSQVVLTKASMDSRLTKLTADREQLAADLQDDKQRRFRRLAGLPEPTAPAPQLEARQEMISRPRIQTGLTSGGYGMTVDSVTVPRRPAGDVLTLAARAARNR